MCPFFCFLGNTSSFIKFKNRVYLKFFILTLKIPWAYKLYLAREFTFYFIYFIFYIKSFNTLKVCLSSIKVCLLFYYICVPCNSNLCFRFHNYFSTLSDLISLFTKAKFSTEEFHWRNANFALETIYLGNR